MIVGGGSAGMGAGQQALRRIRLNRVLVLEAGRPDYRLDVFVHMPAALTFPIGSRLYDWRYESEPEPSWAGAVLPRAGQGPGRLSSINGMIFQRGNPLDYERWAADWGMEWWDFAHCLPYFKRMENCLAGSPDDRGAATTGRSSSNAGPPQTRCSGHSSPPPGGRLPADRRRQRLPAGGLRPVRPDGPRGRRLCAARAYLNPVPGRAT